MVSLLVASIVGVAIALAAFLLGHFLTRNRTERYLSELHVLRPAVADRETLQRTLQEARVAMARMEEQLQTTKEKLEWTEQAEEKLREMFDSLSVRALRNNAEEIQKRSNETLEAFKSRLDGDWNTQRESFRNLLDPVGKELEKLDRQVREMEKNRQGAYQSLSEQVVDLVKRNQELHGATVKLSTALRSSQTRGKWGEVQLRRIVEMAGMVEHVDFDEQAQSEGQRPDMIVRLPEEGIIPVDAKSPMEAYLAAQEAPSEEEMNKLLAAHARALRQHMNDLAKKAYWEQFDRSPEFVVMLIPYESGLSAGFSADPELLEQALAKRVLIVSPVTLLALLKTTALGWVQVKLTRNAQEIADRGREIAGRFGVFLSHFSEIGSELNGAVASYNKAVASAERRLIPSLRRLSESTVSSDVAETPVAIESKARVIDDIAEQAGELDFGEGIAGS